MPTPPKVSEEVRRVSKIVDGEVLLENISKKSRTWTATTLRFSRAALVRLGIREGWTNEAGGGPYRRAARGTGGAVSAALMHGSQGKQCRVDTSWHVFLDLACLGK